MSRLRPDHPRCRSATWICMLCGRTHDVVIYSKIHRNLLTGFGAPHRGSKFALSNNFGYWLLQQLVLP